MTLWNASESATLDDMSNHTTTTRRAVVKGTGITLQSVSAYLPRNYEVMGWDETGTAVVIEGHDNAGWTLDDYVLPRLASGLYFGTEVVPSTTPLRGRGRDRGAGVSRYRITERPWFTEREVAGVELQVTDLFDSRTGTVYADGAYRVVGTDGRRVGRIEKGERAFDFAMSTFRDEVGRVEREDYVAYRNYVEACDFDSCEPHSQHMWRIHGRPEGPLG